MKEELGEKEKWERGIFMRSAGVLLNKGCERLKVQNGKTGHCS